MAKRTPSKRNRSRGGKRGILTKRMKKEAAKRPQKIDVDSPATYAPAATDSETQIMIKRNEDNADRNVAGFIFMCSAETKPECFQYRVFGLPEGKMEVVEKIKKGTKLFLFDFHVKMLYGIYKATCKGKKSLEPDAFRGAFPSQVKFRIWKECIPLPESVFKRAIEENYFGKAKFHPELTNEQVKKLSLLFKQIPSPQVASLSPYVDCGSLASRQLLPPRGVSHATTRMTSSALASQMGRSSSPHYMHLTRYGTYRSIYSKETLPLQSQRISGQNLVDNQLEADVPCIPSLGRYSYSQNGSTYRLHAATWSHHPQSLAPYSSGQYHQEAYSMDSRVPLQKKNYARCVVGNSEYRESHFPAFPRGARSTYATSYVPASSLNIHLTSSMLP